MNNANEKSGDCNLQIYKHIALVLLNSDPVCIWRETIKFGEKSYPYVLNKTREKKRK